MRKIIFLFFISFSILLLSCNNTSTEKNDKDNIREQIENDNQDTIEITTENSDFDILEKENNQDEDLNEVQDTDNELVITKKVELQTTFGNIVLGLYGKEMPKTTENFINYVKEQFYDGLIFHRVIKGFVIQGGGYFPDMQVNPATQMPLNFEKSTKVKHLKYALSMARAKDINSATTQFFITLAPQPSLDYTSDDDFTNPKKYPCAAFGIVLQGQNIVDKIGNIETDKNDMPKTQILINKAIIIK